MTPSPISFRDLILARKYAGLIAGGASWGAIARSVHRSGPVASLTAQSLHVGAPQAIYARRGERPERARRPVAVRPRQRRPTTTAGRVVRRGRSGRGGGRLRRGGRALPALPRASIPATAVAAFNRANCLRAAGRAAEAAHDYARAIKLDPGFVEAWFNLAGLLSERGHDRRGAPPSAEGDRARPRLCRRRSSTSPRSNSTPAISPRRGAGGCAISSSTSDSEWARTAARGIAVRRSAARATIGGLRWRPHFLFDGPEDAPRHHPARAWRRRADGFGLDDRHRQGAGRRRLPRRALRIRLHGGAPHRRAASRRRAPRRSIPEYIAAIADLGRQRAADHRRQVDGRARRQHGRRRAVRARAGSPGCSASAIPSIRPAKPEQLRTKHLAGLKTPTLICQGTRDEFGTRDEVGELWAVRRDRGVLARGRRPRSQAAQEHLGLFHGADHLEDAGRSGAGVDGRIASDAR